MQIPRGQKGERCAAAGCSQKLGSPPPSNKFPSLLPSSNNLAHALLPQSLSPPALGLMGGARAPNCARVPLKSRETCLPPLPPPLTSFPLTSRRCCSKNKGRGRRSRCRGSPEPCPSPVSSGAAYGNASSLPSWPPVCAYRWPGMAGRSRSGATAERGRRGPGWAASGGLRKLSWRGAAPLPPEASCRPGACRAALEAELPAPEGGGTRPSSGLLPVPRPLVVTSLTFFPTPLSANESPAPGQGLDRGGRWGGVEWRPDSFSGSEESRDPGAPPLSAFWRVEVGTTCLSTLFCAFWVGKAHHLVNLFSESSVS